MEPLMLGARRQQAVVTVGMEGTVHKATDQLEQLPVAAAAAGRGHRAEPGTVAMEAMVK